MKKIFCSKMTTESVIFLFIGITACSPGKQIGTPVSPEEIAQAINNDQWIFKADYVMPTYGRSRNITGYYEVRCNKDTLNIALPYFGKLNSPGTVSNTSPLDFQSTDFSLKKEEINPGQWQIIIKTNDYREVQSMLFHLHNNGSAHLDIVMTSRTGINFTGRVEPIK